MNHEGVQHITSLSRARDIVLMLELDNTALRAKLDAARKDIVKVCHLLLIEDGADVYTERVRSAEAAAMLARLLAEIGEKP